MNYGNCVKGLVGLLTALHRDCQRGDFLRTSIEKKSCACMSHSPRRLWCPNPDSNRDAVTREGF